MNNETPDNAGGRSSGEQDSYTLHPMPDTASQNLSRFLEVTSGHNLGQLSINRMRPGGKFASTVVHSIDEAAELVREFARDSCVWVGINPLLDGVGKGKRGQADDVSALVALPVDFDVKEGQCRDLAHAQEIINALTVMLGFEPVLVASGHGLQPRWMLEPLVFAGEESRSEAQDILKRWADFVSSIAREHGCESVDSVFDLTRVFRAPSTRNFKDPANPKPVMLLSLGSAGQLPLARVLEVLDAYTPPTLKDESLKTPPSAQASTPYRTWGYDVCLDCEKYGQGALNKELAKLAPMSKDGDGRNTQYFASLKAVAELVAGGALPQSALDELMQEARRTGLPESEIRSVISSASKRIEARDMERIHREGGHFDVPMPSTASSNGTSSIEATTTQGADLALLKYEQAVQAKVFDIEVNQAAKEKVQSKRNPPREMPPPVRLTEFLQESDERPADIIDGWWPAGGRLIFSGQRKAGKSTAVGNLVRALADGDPWLEKFETQRKSVFLLDDELSRAMLQGWLRDHHIENTDAVRVASVRGYTGALNLATPEGIARLVEMVAGSQILIIDCLRPLLAAAGADENSNSDVMAFLAGVDEAMVRAGLEGVIIVHHHGHQNDRAVGASVLEGWPDAYWTLTKDKKEDDTAPRFIRAFGRDVEIGESQLNHDSNTRRLTFTGGNKKQAASASAEPDVFAVVQGWDPSEEPSTTDIETDLRLKKHNRDAIRGALKDLTGKGSIVKVKRRRQGGGFTYHLGLTPPTTPTTPQPTMELRERVTKDAQFPSDNYAEPLPLEGPKSDLLRPCRTCAILAGQDSTGLDDKCRPYLIACRGDEVTPPA